jgi:hypothetical protein
MILLGFGPWRERAASVPCSARGQLSSGRVVVGHGTQDAGEAMSGNVERVSEESERRERSYAVLIRGRERVRTVLEPHLGPVHALERANNIAQALVFADTEPRGVAFEMLRQLPTDVRSELAEAVTNAWFTNDEPS